MKKLAISLALDWHSLSWAAPLLAGFGLSVAARLLEVYRYRWGARPAQGPVLTLDKALVNWFGRATQVSTPALRLGWWWKPRAYQRAGWIFRSAGLGLLTLTLFRWKPPDFASFMFVKGFVGALLLAESAGLFVPLLVSRLAPGWRTG